MDPDDLARLERLEHREDLRLLDRKISREKRGFATHAAIYAVLIPTLWLVYFVTARHGVPPWPLFAMLGWGMGLMGHGFGMRQKVRQLEEERDDLRDGTYLASPARRPEIALPPEPHAVADTLARAEALLQRERTR